MPDNTALGGFTNTTLSEAAWAKVSLILAELDARLDQCKPSLKGELLRSQCKEEKREKVEYLSNDARDALYYIARWDRIKTPFAVWLAQRDSKNGYKKYTHAKKVRS